MAAVMMVVVLEDEDLEPVMVEAVQEAVEARGGRHGHGGGYGYNNDDVVFFNGPRFNPNLGSHLPNYSLG